MKCPACGKVMIVVEREQIELDVCASCGGVWFDSEELEALFRSAGIDAGPLDAAQPAETREKKRRCPRCRKKMRKLNARDVIVDSCARGDGMWLDGGELSQLAKTVAPEGKALEFLSQVFGGQG